MKRLHTAMHPAPELIDDLIHRIVVVASPLRVVLFGSAAWGDMHPDSDLDVLVVVPEGTPRRRTAQRIYRRMIGFPTAVDVIVATGGDLHKHRENFSLIYYPAIREGKEIYAAGLS